MSRAEWLAWLREMADGDLPAARQTALLRLVWQEAYLTRQGLIARVEALLGRGCFGPSPRAALESDMTVVRQALADAGHELAYGRHGDREGYYVEGRPLLDERLQRLIAGAVAEVDPRQIAIYRRLEPATRVWQATHLSDWLRNANKRRLRQQGRARQ
ncbi:MAG: hypothetical protein MAG451_01239 [Anaerolineales bacterium]|nr:hypothetical protein [Anaerolineales bacterium]